MAKTPSAIPAQTLAFYDKLVATCAGVERKGAAMPYTSVDGHMFSFLTPDGKLALRLADAEREAFIDRYKAELCEQHGKVLSEYVVVPESLLKNMAQLKKFFKSSCDYVSSLKPKPTAKKKAARKKAK